MLLYLRFKCREVRMSMATIGFYTRCFRRLVYRFVLPTKPFSPLGFTLPSLFTVLFSLLLVSRAFAVDAMSDKQMQTLYIPAPDVKTKPKPKDECEQYSRQDGGGTFGNQNKQRLQIKLAECKEKAKDDKKDKEKEGLADLNGDGVIDEKDVKLYAEKSKGLLASLVGEEGLTDLNGDGVVDATDAQILLQKQQAKSPLIALIASGALADLNGDGRIDAADVAALSPAQSAQLLAGLLGDAALGDLNDDGVIDAADASMATTGVNSTSGMGLLAKLVGAGALGDVNGDGKVDASDLPGLQGQSGDQSVNNNLLALALGGGDALTDLNGDGVINGQDAALMYDANGGSSALLLAQMVASGGLSDLNGDGAINADDLILLSTDGGSNLLAGLISSGALFDANGDGLLNKFDLFGTANPLGGSMLAGAGVGFGLNNNPLGLGGLFGINSSGLDTFNNLLNGDGSSSGMTAEDFLGLFGLSSGGFGQINLSGLLGLGEGLYSDGLLSSLANWQNQQALNSILSTSGENPLSRLEAILAGQLGQSLLSSLLGGSSDNFGEGPSYRYIDYIYEPITDEHHLEITKISTGWRVIDVEISR